MPPGGPDGRPAEGMDGLLHRGAQGQPHFHLVGRTAQLSRQPVGPKDFGKLFNRMTSVGSYNYVQVRYLLDHLAHEKMLAEMAHRVRGGGFTAFPARDPPKADNLMKEDPPENPKLWVY